MWWTRACWEGVHHAVWGTKRLWPWIAQQCPLNAMAGGQKVAGAQKGKKRLSVRTTLPPVTPHCFSPLLLEGGHGHLVPPAFGSLPVTSSPPHMTLTTTQ